MTPARPFQQLERMAPALRVLRWGATTAPPSPSEVEEPVRAAVRALLRRTPAYATAPEQLRTAVADRMVRAALMAADLILEERRLTQQAERRPPLAAAQAAGDRFDAKSGRAAADVLKATRDAIDFPNFVTSLINGVFQAITGSTLHQLERFADLMEHVTASGDAFAASNVRDSDVGRWALSKVPSLTVNDAGELVVREGSELAAQRGMLKETLGASDTELDSIDEADLAGTLLPLCKRKMGRDRQAILATMVQLGLQRVVVDEGRLHASMDMRVDTSSVSEELEQDRSAVGVDAEVKGSFGLGPWGASARVATNFSKVHADQQSTKEEMSVRAGLRSSVDLAFRTEQIPLDRVADEKARVKLNLNAMVPVDVSAKTLDGKSSLQPVDMTAPVTPNTISLPGDQEKKAAEGAKAKAETDKKAKPDGDKKADTTTKKPGDPAARSQPNKPGDSPKGAEKKTKEDLRKKGTDSAGGGSK